MSILDRVRPDLAHFKAYQAAVAESDAVRLNANETPRRHRADQSLRGLNLYPPERPKELSDKLAAHFGVDASELLITRGSSEAIDLLIRLFCRPYADSIVVCQPTFGMYAVYAHVQGAAVHDVPRGPAPNFKLDVEGILASWQESHKLLFLTSPNNPTGTAVSREELDALITGLKDKAVIVVDSAYCEFGNDPEPQQRLIKHEHVVVLRTLSKAYGLAGTRCGALIASPAICGLVNRLLAPYALATPVIEAILAVFNDEGIDESQRQVTELIETRKWFGEELIKLSCVESVCDSDTNFLFVRFSDAPAAAVSAREAGILLRHYPNDEKYSDYLRITIGERSVMKKLLSALTLKDREK